ANLQLDAMNGGADRDVADGQGIADADRGLRTGQQCGTHFDVARRNDVTTLAIGVAQQGNVGRAVWIVFDALHFGRDVVLGATKIHHPVVVLVTTTLVTNRDVTVVVATGLLELWLQQRRKTLTLVKVVTRNLDHATAAW